MEEIRKNILIVCEGEGAEPNYFNHYRNILIDKKSDISIVIRPKPKNEESDEPLILRKGARRRTLKQVLNEPNGDIVEPEYRTQPTKYVREAQLSLEDGTFDEVWAVYDKDDHPKQKDAFELSQKRFNNKVVQIGFTSIAFEYWILLHFQLNTTIFEKALCRDGRPDRALRYCGSKTHHQDCFGNKCVCGCIVTNGFLNYQNCKKEFLIEEYAPQVDTAIVNAIQLRKSKQGNGIIFYNENPYTTLYRLVFKLLHLQQFDFHFFDATEIQITQDFSIEFSIQAAQITITIALEKEISFVVNQDTVVLVNISGEILDIGINKLIIPGQGDYQFTINLTQHHQFAPIFVGFKTSPDTFSITEI